MISTIQLLSRFEYFYMQVVKQEYTAKGATFETEMRVDFESNSISLQEVNLEDGWRIFPMFRPEVGTVHAH